MITSLQNERIKELIKLKQKKYRDLTQKFLVEGYHLVEEARKHGLVECVIVTNEEFFEEETLVVSKHIMEKLSFTKTPQPIMAVCRIPKMKGINKEGKRFLLLERVQDPGNVGTLIRTALAFGYDQVILSSDSVDLYNDKVIRSTQGALFQMNIITMDIKEAVEVLKQNQVLIYGTSLRNAKSIKEYQKQERMAFIVGNEGQGMSDELCQLCDCLLYIPITSIESLNVAIAGAIAMYQFQ